MDGLTERVSYLKGLCDGLKINHETDEGKILVGILDILGDMAEEIEYISADQFEMQELIDEIDEDLGGLEEDYYGECDCDCDCDCDDETEFYEMECPNCGETICVDDSGLFDDGIVCPNCNENIELDFDDCDCDCDCCDCEE